MFACNNAEGGDKSGRKKGQSSAERRSSKALSASFGLCGESMRNGAVGGAHLLQSPTRKYINMAKIQK